MSDVDNVTMDVMHSCYKSVPDTGDCLNKVLYGIVSQC